MLMPPTEASTNPRSLGRDFAGLFINLHLVVVASLLAAAHVELLLRRLERRPDRARLRARAALLSGRPHQALLELADDNSEEANALRAQAMVSTEDFAAAGDMLRDLEQNEAASRYFWLAGVSDERLEPAGGKYAALNQTTQALSDLPERLAEKPLADAENLLKDSQSARQRIDEMLNAVGVK